MIVVDFGGRGFVREDGLQLDLECSSDGCAMRLGERDKLAALAGQRRGVALAEPAGELVAMTRSTP
jgi:hypothetical protein